MPRKIILDCDPGHDDAIAMILAHASPQIDLAAVTTVAGNQILEKVTANALAVATVAGITDVPIAAGAGGPLVREQIEAGSIHGESGLDGPVLPEPAVRLHDAHAVDLIIDVVMSHPPDEITLVPVGPLTNIALAMRKEPRIVDRVAEVVLMGGGYARGNRTAVAEFNLIADPEAGHAVFSAAWQVTMVGLDLTHQATATADVIERIAALGTPAARFVVELLEFFGSTYAAVGGMPHPPVHDPCAVARVIDPSIMTVREANVSVELTGTHTYGMTVTDFRGLYGAPRDTDVAIELDRTRFWDLVVDAIASLPDSHASSG